MKQYRAGDILLIAFPFSSGGAKRRPAMVLADVGDNDVIVARVTSSPAQTMYDVVVRDWQSAGLLAPSAVRVDKLATLEKSLIERHLGSLTDGDKSSVATTVQALLDWTDNADDDH
jgi:mRNA interferase MazF